MEKEQREVLRSRIQDAELQLKLGRVMLANGMLHRLRDHLEMAAEKIDRSWDQVQQELQGD